MKDVELILGDCLEEMKRIPDESIDLVLTDPAYESMMKWQGIGTTARMGMGKKGSGSDNLDKKWFDVIPNDDLPDLIREIYRILKPERHAYIMCDFETLKLLYYFAIEEGVFPSQKISGIDVESCKPLIWDKVIAGTGYTYRTVYEFVFMLWKGKKRRLNDLGIQDILRFKKPWGNERIFPTQKPVELMKVLIEQSTQPGEIVLDSFLGSGTTAVACVETNRKFIGIEINPETMTIAEQRIKESLSQPRLI
jgi:site-specific DNA-methyltransferase (adenine-specific)